MLAGFSGKAYYLDAYSLFLEEILWTQLWQLFFRF
jgi:hypothetical protein